MIWTSPILDSSPSSDLEAWLSDVVSDASSHDVLHDDTVLLDLLPPDIVPVALESVDAAASSSAGSGGDERDIIRVDIEDSGAIVWYKTKGFYAYCCEKGARPRGCRGRRG